MDDKLTDKERFEIAHRGYFKREFELTHPPKLTEDDRQEIARENIMHSQIVFHMGD